MLDSIPRRSVRILSAKSGRVWTLSNFSGQFAKTMKNLGLRDLVFHGLRKTVAKRLADAGATELEIMAVTGHESSAMVKHYTKGANQKIFAKSALEKVGKSALKRSGSGNKFG